MDKLYQERTDLKELPRKSYDNYTGTVLWGQNVSNVLKRNVPTTVKMHHRQFLLGQNGLRIKLFRISGIYFISEELFKELYL